MMCNNLLIRQEWSEKCQKSLFAVCPVVLVETKQNLPAAY